MPKPGETGRWLRRLHLGLASLGVLLFIGVGLVATINDRLEPSAPAEPSAPTGPTPSVETAASPTPTPLPEAAYFELGLPFDLGVGECFDVSFIVDEIQEIIPRQCHHEHSYEVYSSVVLTQVGYPNEFDLEFEFNFSCSYDFQIYMGVPWEENPAVGYFGLVPTIDVWRNGDRTIECVVYHLTEDRLDYSLRRTGLDGVR